MTKRADWIRYIVGSKGDDDLKGTAGRDVILGRNGADVLEGGAGNDILVGDDVHWSWNHCYWGKSRGSHDDYLDGGAGSDVLLAGRGNDVANYALSENLQSHDVYDGGKGFDTLQLTLTHAELQLASVQEDIAAFEAFLARKANPYGDSGRTFHFQSFDLDVRDFEALKIQVIGGNTAPVARNDSYSLEEDTVVLVAEPGVAGNDSDAEGSALSVTLVAGPAHGALVLNAKGSFSYTPEANFSGTDSFTYKANDGTLDSDAVAVTLTVAPVNDAPVAADDAAATDEDVPVSGNVIDNAADAEGDALTAALVGGPSHGSLDLAADGSYAYTPVANFSGTDSFTYRVSDGRASSGIATVTLVVAPVNDAPVAADGQSATDEDVPVSGNVIESSADADGDALTAALLGGPSNGTLDFAADGSFTYTPAADFFGTDSFTYLVSDGMASSNVATLTLIVAPVNDAPVAADDEVAIDEDASVTGYVTDNATDAEDDSLTATLLGGPSHGALDFAADGSFTYTPAADFFGADSFTYQVSDGQAGSNIATVNLAVAPVNDAPEANDDVIPEHAIAAGAIRVAVIGGSSSSFVAAAAQLEDSTAFRIDADAIPVRAFTSQDQWAALLENYDVAVLGDSGFGLDYGATPLFPALHGFVDAGGGVVTAGWFAYILPTLSAAVRADADYITPIAAQPYQFARNGSTITVIDNTHPITDGIASYRVNAAVHELAGGIDAGATVLARGVSGSASLPALVVDEVGQGRTAYFGSLQMASASTYSPDRVAGGTVDQIFERAVAWAAGVRDVYAATDEDTPLAIDAARLLANDGDIENDALAIGAVSATSALGAAVSIGAGGSILYDPTAALQSLKPGQVVTDSFDYTVYDGNGGMDIATVSLSVAGRADTDLLL